MKNKRVWYAVAVGAVLLVLGMALRGLADQEGLQLVLLVPTFLIVGFVAAGAKRGFLVGFVVTIVFALVNNVFFPQWSFGNPSEAAASLIMLVLIPAVIFGALATVGGFIGRKVLR